jgi:hypothetical protein
MQYQKFLLRPTEGLFILSTNDGGNLMLTLQRVVLTCGAYALLVMGSGQQVHAQCLSCPRGGECQFKCEMIKKDVERFQERSPSSNPQNYGAIAFSKKTHAYGVDSNSLTQRRADSIAMSECTSNAGDCAVEVQFSNTCAALARTISPISGIFMVKSAINSSKTLAQANALSACETESGQRCKPVTSECSP